MEKNSQKRSRRSLNRTLAVVAALLLALTGLGVWWSSGNDSDRPEVAATDAAATGTVASTGVTTRETGTSNVQTSGVQTSGVQTTGVPTSGGQQASTTDPTSTTWTPGTPGTVTPTTRPTRTTRPTSTTVPSTTRPPSTTQPTVPPTTKAPVYRYVVDLGDLSSRTVGSPVGPHPEDQYCEYSWTITRQTWLNGDLVKTEVSPVRAFRSLTFGQLNYTNGSKVYTSDPALGAYTTGTLHLLWAAKGSEVSNILGCDHDWS